MDDFDWLNDQIPNHRLELHPKGRYSASSHNISVHGSRESCNVCYLKWARSALRDLWLEVWGSSC